uniref:C2H2-type domain-containing protein n=1 Tax=Branchiostoma floridae TaxID=7739 RepID=C3YE66_BRAFL|eukprot:XP_002605364.1 hypothetical protein BRAFLDRAFT_278495 [Branchiostoma floridae]
MLESHGKVEYKCDNCDFVATAVGKVHQHQLGHQRTHKCNETHHKSPSMLSCKIFGKEVPKPSNKRHCQRHQGNFTCPICSKSFQSKVALKIHSDVIHEDKVLKCSHCEKTFKSYGGYMVHRHVHISKEHTCKDCNMKFPSKTQLYNHRSRAHLSLKECEVCGKLFDLSRLDDHMKTHMGEEAKVYKCTLCPASFKWSQTLRRHQSIHEGLKKCSECKKDYRGSRQLKRHMAKAHKEQT